MASEIKVDTIVNAGGDNDSGIDLATNDNIKFNIAGSQKAIIESNGRLGVGISSPSQPLVVSNGTEQHQVGFASGEVYLMARNASAYITQEYIANQHTFTGYGDSSSNEAMRIDSSGNLMVSATATSGFQSSSSNSGSIIYQAGGIASNSATNDVAAVFNRIGTDGTVVLIKAQGNSEGSISVSSSTVSYEGFSGLHESSGIATNTPLGTVVSTIDELDVYPTGTTKEGQTRADHAKVEVSNTVGDSAVYGVVSRFDDNDKVFVASVGIGSVRVTGACAKGDLLESNGDGTAKVQSDDIVRSKTIGKVTIGNSNTGVKLVSCVLYCG